ncbi:MAG: Fe-S cluster assembly protein SufD [Pseudomonadota bacterium]
MNALATSTPEEVQIAERYNALRNDARRARAFEAYADHGLPHRRVEGWRWSDLRVALKGLGRGEAAPKDPFQNVDAAVFRFDDNGFTPPKSRPAGVRWISQLETPAFGGAEELPMAALAAALADDPSAVVIEIGGELAAPLRLVFEGSGDRFHHVAVIVRQGGAAHIVESHLSGGGFANTALEFEVEDGARLDRTIYQAGVSESVGLVTAKAHVGAGSNFTQSALAFGSKLSRLETHLSFQKSGGVAVLDGAYLLDDGFHADTTTHVRHMVGHCETQQLIKGAVKSGGKGVFQGKFLVARDAQKTDAQMAHHALLLEDGGEVNAKPELEIYADDVQCAHGNTTGALDADALFYMRQRGIPEADAKAILTASFVAEAFERIDNDEVKEIFEQEASRWLMASL